MARRSFRKAALTVALVAGCILVYWGASARFRSPVTPATVVVPVVATPAEARDMPIRSREGWGCAR